MLRIVFKPIYFLKEIISKRVAIKKEKAAEQLIEELYSKCDK